MSFDWKMDGGNLIVEKKLQRLIVKRYRWTNKFLFVIAGGEKR